MERTYTNLLLLLVCFGACASIHAARVPDLLHRHRLRTSGKKTEVSAFITIGDWGCPDTWKYPHATALQVAQQMATVARDNNIDFIVSTGDNFYPRGVKSVDDPQWRGSFEDVYTQDSLRKRWYTVLGNHDVRGNVQAQIDYTNSDVSKRWHFPAPRYDQWFPLPHNRKLYMLFLNTNLWDFRDSAPDASRLSSVANDEKLAIETLIATASQSADFILVVGHHGVESAGEHGPLPKLSWLKELLERYKVSAYLNGHDHIMTHLESNGVHYIGSGGGCQLQGEVRQNDFTKFAQKANGFDLHSFLEDGKMKVTIYSQNGAALSQWDVLARQLHSVSSTSKGRISTQRDKDENQSTKEEDQEEELDSE